MAGSEPAVKKSSPELSPPVPLGTLGSLLMGLYLLVLPVLLLAALVALFPSAAATGTHRFPAIGLPGGLVVGPFRDEQGFLMLAILAGAVGSYIHAAQSYAAYIGNRQVIASWLWWYLLRAPIGATLGLLVYVLMRAGLIAGTAQTGEAVSPYGVVAFAAMAGWFSKQATDKLAEVFDTLFRSAKSQEYKDKLAPQSRLRIDAVTPSAIPQGATDISLVVLGTGFAPGVNVLVEGMAIETEYVDAGTLRAKLPANLRPAPGTEAALTVKNSGSDAAPSAPVMLTGV